MAEPGTGTQRLRVTRVGAGAREFADFVIAEEPLLVRLGHRGRRYDLATTMRTPGHDLELAVGIAVAEGLLRGPADLVSARACWTAGDGEACNEVLVVVRDERELDPARFVRLGPATSACGVCGRADIDAMIAELPEVRQQLQVPAETLLGLPAAMVERQRLFRRTGGVHAAGLAQRDGRLLVVREDVGRHNAVDKVVGHALTARQRPEILVVSGRAGFEIVAKAATAGIPIVVAVSAPTAMSVQASRAAGITLMGFVRGGSANIYSHPERVT